MKCLNAKCGVEMLNRVCSKKENGIFYFMCEDCMTVHKAQVNTETFELEIILAPDEDCEKIAELMTGTFGEDLDKVNMQIAFKVVDESNE